MVKTKRKLTNNQWKRKKKINDFYQTIETPSEAEITGICIFTQSSEIINELDGTQSIFRTETNFKPKFHIFQVCIFILNNDNSIS